LHGQELEIFADHIQGLLAVVLLLLSGVVKCFRVDCQKTARPTDLKVLW